MANEISLCVPFIFSPSYSILGAEVEIQFNLFAA